MTRTPKQIAADKVNREMKAVSRELMTFGVVYEDYKLIETARQITSLRTRVRAHMHHQDREETQNG